MEAIHRTAHPRPDWVRQTWQTLNGTWRFRFDWKNEGRRQRWYQDPRFDLNIQVPFAYQAELSGIEEKRQPDFDNRRSKTFSYETACLLFFGLSSSFTGNHTSS